jgi:hypothetical protein
LQQQQQQQWGVRSYSQSTTPTAAPAQPQQQQQEQPAVPSASEAATSSFINAPAATAAASGTPAAAAGAAVTAAAAAASVGGVLAGAATAELKEYSMRQVSKHASDETCWIVVNGKVRVLLLLLEARSVICSLSCVGACMLHCCYVWRGRLHLLLMTHGNDLLRQAGSLQCTL